MNQHVDPLDIPFGINPAAKPPANPFPHEVECVVLQRLQNHPALRFSSLNVHRCGHDSICIEGFLESNDEHVDLVEVVRGIHGIKSVVNRVVTTHPQQVAPSSIAPTQVDFRASPR